MKIGTKSVLYGAHQFLIHPWFVALGWWKLYGFPFDPRLWVAFFLHDIGYLGKPNMDGDEGEQHPKLGAMIMWWLFDWPKRIHVSTKMGLRTWAWEFRISSPSLQWHDFVMYHSRFLAKAHGRNPSRLCIADKLAIALTPSWLFVPMVRATGEVKEYREQAASGAYANRTGIDDYDWHAGVREYCYKYAFDHRYDQHDTVTIARSHT